MLATLPVSVSMSTTATVQYGAGHILTPAVMWTTTSGDSREPTVISYSRGVRQPQRPRQQLRQVSNLTFHSQALEMICTRYEDISV